MTNAGRYTLRKNNSSGFTGVSYCRHIKKYRASVAVDGKQITLGFFEDALDAGEARVAYCLANYPPPSDPSCSMCGRDVEKWRTHCTACRSKLYRERKAKREGRPFKPQQRRIGTEPQPEYKRPYVSQRRGRGGRGRTGDQPVGS